MILQEWVPLLQLDGYNADERYTRLLLGNLSLLGTPTSFTVS